ncbi:MAG: glutamyl-tRNA amidotransferase [Oscillospiraceae bacterium]|nr:glutamyl-tRNA amidotransferase [Oscillospiraceae bacterium]
MRCKNYIDGELRDYSARCKAFPDGIPEMKLAYISYETCIDCNNGIGFEPENIEYTEKSD